MAMASDFTVEVRDINFNRVGQIAPEYLDLKYSEVFRSVGKWELKLPAEHPLLATLKTKGSGIIVTRAGASRPFSGRMQSCVLSQDATDPKGTWVISGVDDNIIAAATACYPDPANSADAQTAAYWTVTGNGETVMKNLVAYNIGATAIAARKYSWLGVATNLSRGAAISASLRFDNMGDALAALGTRANLGWRFYQSAGLVVFDVFTPSDKSATIRLDIRNGGIDSTELGYSAPSATQVLVLGQGEGSDRTVKPVTTTASLSEATAWGLRWEVVKDERNTNVDTELQQAGEEILTGQGSTVNSLKVTPSDAPNQRLGIDWDLGDLVTVVIDNTPAVSTVTEIARSITSAGVLTQATVGDPVGFDWEAQVATQLDDQDSRISSLEATVNAAVPLTAGSTNLAGMIQLTAAAAAPAGWLICDGSAVSRTTYSKLFTALGTTYGAGNGSTTFNLPNLKGRIPAGLDTSQAEFATRGQTGGEKYHPLTVDEMPVHNHIAPSHKSSLEAGGYGLTQTGGFQDRPHVDGATVAATNNAGGGQAHNNLQPYLVLNYIIKT